MEKWFVLHHATDNTVRFTLFNGKHDSVYIIQRKPWLGLHCSLEIMVGCFNLKRTLNVSFAVGVLGHERGVRRVESLRQHGLPEEEHVLQHALTDRQETCRTRYPKGESENENNRVRESAHVASPLTRVS